MAADASLGRFDRRTAFCANTRDQRLAGSQLPGLPGWLTRGRCSASDAAHEMRVDGVTALMRSDHDVGVAGVGAKRQFGDLLSKCTVVVCMKIRGCGPGRDRCAFSDRRASVRAGLEVDDPVS